MLLLTREQARSVCDAVVSLWALGGIPAKIRFRKGEAMVVVRISDSGVKVTLVSPTGKAKWRTYPTLAHFAAAHQEAR